MCEKTRKKLNALPTKAGNMTTGTKKGLNLIIDEIEKVNAKVDEVAKNQEKTDNNVLEVLKLVNNINEKISVDKIEEKAAIMDAVSSFGKTTFGKIILFFIFVCGGLAMAYIIEHGVFTIIAEWLK